MSGLNNRIKAPFGVPEQLSFAYAATLAIAPWNMESVFIIAQLTGNITINSTNDAETPVGANLSLKMSADGTNRTVTLGTGFLGNSITVTASKSVIAEFKYDGSKWNHLGTTTLN
jgi:hypothetical protein